MLTDRSASRCSRTRTVFFVSTAGTVRYARSGGLSKNATHPAGVLQVALADREQRHRIDALHQRLQRRLHRPRCLPDRESLDQRTVCARTPG